MEFCDTAGTVGFGQWLEASELALHSHYNCSKNFTRCTKHEIAVKQWARSEITQNPPKELPQFKPSYSGQGWFPESPLY
jgi:hypothetical protein